MSNIPVQAITCSPRAKGNSDYATRMFMQGILEAGGTVEYVPLRQYTVHHCISCQHCERDPAGKCALEQQDQSAELYRLLLEAPMLFFASPVYFYHVPSLFKAFIDRTQCFWIRHAKGDPFMRNLPPRTAHLVMMGARKQGDRLFDGAILTMQYFLRPFNITLAPPTLFYGKEGPTDLKNDITACDQLLELGKVAAQTL